MTDDNTQSLILAELQSLRADFNAHARQTGERLSALEAQMYTLCGNGQPGRIAQLEEDLEMLMGWRWWIVGAFAAMCSVIPVTGWLIDYLIK